MKRFFISMMAAAAVVFAFQSCETKQDPEDNPGTDVPTTPEDEDPEEQNEEVTYNFIASPLQGKWTTGDKIYVHGNLGSWSEVITLSAADISEDGKTAHAKLGEVTENLANPDGLYAAWPDDAVKHVVTKIGAKTSFESFNSLLTAAYLDGDTFTFIDVSSSLTFTVSGDYDQYTLVANNYDGLAFTSFDVEYTSAKKSFSTKNNGEPFKTGKLESGKQVSMYMPGQYSFKTGLTIYVGKGGEWPLACTIDNQVTLQPGETTDLGDITAFLRPYEGPGPKVPVMGKRTKLRVKFNELSGLCLSSDGDFFWSVGDNGELAQIDLEGNLLNRVTLKWKSGNEEGGYDTEGITIDPTTGDILCAEEPNYVGRITFADQANAFSQDAAYNILNTIFRIDAASNYGNSGTEGITYYKDGLVYVGAQSSADLFLCELATGKVISRKSLKKSFPAISEIAGLSYDPVTDWLWIVDSNSPQKIIAISGDASREYAAYYLPDTGNPESICVDRKHSCIWVGDDDESTSYIYRYDFTGL